MVHYVSSRGSGGFSSFKNWPDLEIIAFPRPCKIFLHTKQVGLELGRQWSGTVSWCLIYPSGGDHSTGSYVSW